MRLFCLRGGEPIALEIAAGARSGIACEPTAYPLICSKENRIRGGESIEVDPGSYLLLARSVGREEQRFPFLVPRGGEARPAVSLLSAASSPAGFVFVPPGPFRYGGDPEAFQSGPLEEATLPGFFIGRREVTNREWFEFVNDEETLAKIQAASERRILPREAGRLIARKKPEGRGYEWAGVGAEAPILGISWVDVQDYLEWRNRRGRVGAEPWTYDLPTQQEWEKAARGADGRAFPWGDRFDFSLAIGAYRRRSFQLEVPGGYEPRDESPFGLLDLGGSRQEWTRDLASPGTGGAPPTYYLRGGAWGQSTERAFRSAGRGYASADNVTGYGGFRLVARPRA
ncbi:MAG: formylglycine-generating enzyme family protein [Planctomycetes bacterium]|nr:formylglycine-generating enzyme family protein [Planctomycetota bacterium]